jgi:DNA replication protein DnaC
VLMAELQQAWGDDDRRAALKVLTSAGPIALDDFDKVNATEHVRVQLFTALDKREQSRVPLIVTTNLKPSELSKKLGDVIASRLVGMCVVLPYPGPDRRLEIGD